ncbi:hypothetical protein SDC9_199847 [bioreactor metagenome]|uniref:Uncharacterized protein n=1 Tax=bioreactor metagenome TaxID=1076179 RepID=A0A645ILM4_9ZZZZ
MVFLGKILPFFYIFDAVPTAFHQFQVQAKTICIEKISHPGDIVIKHRIRRDIYGIIISRNRTLFQSIPQPLKNDPVRFSRQREFLDILKERSRIFVGIMVHTGQHLIKNRLACMRIHDRLINSIYFFMLDNGGQESHSALFFDVLFVFVIFE